MTTQTAVFAGGCFWCTEAVFKMLRGVILVQSGYTGGKTKDPTYESVCTGETGHAEAVRIEFDPALVSYRDLLTVFFATHDPTTPNRQGADVGTQYRSAIFYANDTQKEEAQNFVHEIGSSFAGNPIVTQLEPLGEFYPAEHYHNNYFHNNPEAPYCRIVIEPKIEKVRKEFSALLARHDKDNG